MFRKLKNSEHEMALIAQIGICSGIFIKQKTDMLRPYKEDKDFKFIFNFLESSGDFDVEKEKLLNLLSYKPKTLFREFYKLGVNLRKANSFHAFKFCLDLLNKSSQDFAWIAKVGLCHGLFLEDYSEDVFENDFIMLKELVPKHK